MKPRMLAAFIGLAILSGAALRGAFSPEKLALVDRPLQGTNLALAPDGKHLAYTRNDDTRLWLIILDFDSKTLKELPLDSTEHSSGRPPRISALRWVSADRLVLVGADGTIVCVDANGRVGPLLWSKGDDGLVQDSQFRIEPYLVIAGTPRLLPPLADDPNHVLIETVANVGAESFSNAFRVDVRTAQGELIGWDNYYDGQIALYGRGDMVMWPPWPSIHLDSSTIIPGTIEQALLAVGVDDAVPNRLKSFLSSPPSLYNPAGPTEVDSIPVVRRTPFDARFQFEQGAVMRYDMPLLSPQTGGAVSPESSSTGRMIYDRQGWPRILYTEPRTGATREFRYAKSGQLPFDPNSALPTLDAVLGKPKAREFTVSDDNYFGERSYPLAFDFDPNLLYIASSVGRDTYGIYSLDLTTKERRNLAPERAEIDLAPLEPTEADDALVFDEHAKRLVGLRYSSVRSRTQWLDPELSELQSKLDRQFPRHNVEILAWDADRRRFVLRVSAEDDPGAIFVHEPATNCTDLLFSAAPWLSTTTLNASGAFGFTTPDGTTLTGYLTLPDNPKVRPPPVIIYLQGDLWNRAQPGFDPTAEMLADMGCVVMRLNYRGTPGLGRKFRDAIKEGIDTVPVADVLTALDWLRGHSPIDEKRVVVVGEGLGGYLAMRAAGLRPDKFRAAVAIDAPTSLGAWTGWQQVTEPHPMFREGSVESAMTSDFRTEVRKAFVHQIRESKELDASAAKSAANKPATLVIESSGSRETTPVASLLASIGFLSGGSDVERMLTREAFRTGSLATRTEVFKRIETFLNEHLYDFGSSIERLRTAEPASKK